MGTRAVIASMAVEHVRSLERGILLLQAMNRAPQASVTTWARQIDVPRSTAYRLLDTFVAMGLVAANSSNQRYALTRSVYSLSQGFVDEEWIEKAWLETVALTERIKWPVDVLSRDGATMLVRRSTHSLSSFSLDDAMVGQHWPMLKSSAGRAYLTFCPQTERDVILATASASGPTTATPLQRDALNSILDQTKELGVGVRVRGMVPKTGSLSAPVMIGERVLCCISVIWIASALPVERALRELSGPLKDTAARVGEIAERLLGAIPPSNVSRA